MPTAVRPSALAASRAAARGGLSRAASAPLPPRRRRGPVAVRALSTNTYSDTSTRTNTAARVVVSETKGGLMQYSFAGSLPPPQPYDFPDFKPLTRQVRVRVRVCVLRARRGAAVRIGSVANLLRHVETGGWGTGKRRKKKKKPEQRKEPLSSSSIRGGPQRSFSFFFSFVATAATTTASTRRLVSE